VTADPPARRPWWALSWPAVALFAVLVYEATAAPWLAALTVAVKVAWDDLRAAVWLRVRDPDRHRAKAHFWAFTSLGLLKASVAGFVLAMGIVFATVPLRGRPNANRPANPPPDIQRALTAASAVFLVGGLFAPVAGTLAAYHSLRGRTRVWLSPGVYVARERGQWPPWFGRRSADALVFVVAAGAWLFVLLGLAIWAADAIGLGKEATVGATIALVFGYPVAILTFFDWLKARAVPASPYDVWPEPADPAGG
jgi:hypothetical protein